MSGELVYFCPECNHPLEEHRETVDGELLATHCNAHVVGVTLDANFTCMCSWLLRNRQWLHFPGAA